MQSVQIHGSLSFVLQTPADQAGGGKEGLNPSTWEIEETEAVAMVRVQGIKEFAFMTQDHRTERDS